MEKNTISKLITEIQAAADKFSREAAEEFFDGLSNTLQVGVAFIYESGEEDGEVCDVYDDDALTEALAQRLGQNKRAYIYAVDDQDRLICDTVCGPRFCGADYALRLIEVE